MGRPLKPIDGEQVLKLASLGCTNGEIGDYFGVADETIRIRFVDELALGRAGQRISLRRRQWKAAMSGSVPMLIHLGKQYLGQSDRADITSGGRSIVPFEVGDDGRDPGLSLPAEAAGLSEDDE